MGRGGIFCVRIVTKRLMYSIIINNCMMHSYVHLHDKVVGHADILDYTHPPLITNPDHNFKMPTTIYKYPPLFIKYPPSLKNGWWVKRYESNNTLAVAVHAV